jgi:hypothetical protein
VAALALQTILKAVPSAENLRGVAPAVEPMKLL